ncbi:glycine zipper 2TM domain-containing protein [Dyella japonica]|uniref:Membrane protein n=1 Tax=Dyella japonica A8 TaxID=1217721 RepID=A0A075K361_9GAMM|nr:glycine zipper 2TM domain-containing protein [Dyella japonica]AIF48676.1 membrane protein [Dyella japonica A8]
MKARSLATLAATALLGACATAPGASPSGATEIRAGVVEQVSNVQIETNHHTGVGAVVGGAVGLGVGSLIGAGTGRDVAMVLGTVGGAVAGNEVQKHYDKPVAGQQIIVRLKNGVLVSVTQPASTTFRTGEKVYVEGNGENARVVAQP